MSDTGDRHAPPNLTSERLRLKPQRGPYMPALAPLFLLKRDYDAMLDAIRREAEAVAQLEWSAECRVYRRER